MTTYAVVSDIHANYEALKAIEADAASAGIKEFICLGDVVDYGPQPQECVAWTRAHSQWGVLGNHDEDVTAPAGEAPRTILREYWPITLWTRAMLNPDLKEQLRSRPSYLVEPAGLSEVTLLHGDLGPDFYHRIEDARGAQKTLCQLETQIGLFGHTHYQGYFIENPTDDDKSFMYFTTSDSHLPVTRGWRRSPLYQWIPCQEFHKTLINPGSVGQSRRHAVLVGEQHDRCAAYLWLQVDAAGRPEAFQFRRVPYNVELVEAMIGQLEWPVETYSPDKIQSLAGRSLDPYLLETLSLGPQWLEALKAKLVRTLESG